jgi:hypothetical protein
MGRGDVELPALAVAEGDGGQVQGRVATRRSRRLPCIGMDSVQIAAEIDGITGAALCRRVEGDQRTPEGRQVDAQVAGETGEPEGAAKTFGGLSIDPATHRPSGG